MPTSSEALKFLSKYDGPVNESVIRAVGVLMTSKDAVGRLFQQRTVELAKKTFDQLLNESNSGRQHQQQSYSYFERPDPDSNDPTSPRYDPPARNFVPDVSDIAADLL